MSSGFDFRLSLESSLRSCLFPTRSLSSSLREYEHMSSDNNILPLKMKLLEGSTHDDTPNVSLPDCDFVNYHKGLQLCVWLVDI